VEDIGTQGLNLEIGKRFIIIIVFLSILWFALNYLALKIKSGDLKLPDFLSNKLYGGSGVQAKDLHHIELVQKKYLADGCEMIVVDVDGSHVLLARGLNGSITYIKELDQISA
jgi:hypothetical protein